MVGCSIPLSSSRTVREDESGLREPKDLPGSLRARGVIELSGIKDREFKGKAAILVKGPDKVRIEIFDLFGQVAAVIVSDGHALSIFSNNNSSFFSRNGETPLNFTATELASFLMGADIKVSEARKVLFEDYRDQEGLKFPYSLSVDDGKEHLLVRYSSIEFNPELDDTLFVHFVPALP